MWIAESLSAYCLYQCYHTDHSNTTLQYFSLYLVQYYLYSDFNINLDFHWVLVEYICQSYCYHHCYPYYYLIIFIVLQCFIFIYELVSCIQKMESYKFHLCERDFALVQQHCNWRRLLEWPVEYLKVCLLFHSCLRP